MPGPGVVVTTATQSGGAGALQTPSSQGFFVGLLERGSDTDPVLLRGMADVERVLGKRPSYGSVYDQLKVFFEEGGRQAYVARVVGDDADVGTLSLNDRAGTPVPTLRVDAASSGDWSGRVKIEVKDGATTNTFRIVVRLDDEVVEDVNNLTTPAEAVAKFSKSVFVRLTNLGSATAAPNNRPAVLAATVLSTGDDDRGSVAAADYVSALDRFDTGLGDGSVAIPGQTGATVWNGIIAHCELNNRIGILAAAQGETTGNLKSSAAGMDTEYCGLFAPWLIVDDGAFGTRTISPEGFVMAKRSQAHESVGPWVVPAGKAGEGLTIIDVDQNFSDDEGTELSDSKVSAIRRKAGAVRLYEWRSLARDMDNYRYLKDRDVLNRLVVMAEETLEDYVFKPIDGKGHLLSAINSALVGMVQPIADAGGLYPYLDNDRREVDPGYRVETGSEINTDESLAGNEVRARLLVRVSPTGGLVTLNIVKVGILSPLG